MSGDAGTDGPVKVGFPVVDVAVGMLGALAITTALHQRARDGKGQYIDASMAQASLMLMYTNASAFLTQRVEPERIGNRGQSRSPTADTYRCQDGWLALAANTPTQFRKLTALLGLDELCEDANAIDLEAFNAAGGGFVVARNLEYLRTQFHAAFAGRSAREMEVELNARGIPAARVRRLGEFLDEIEDGSKLSFRSDQLPARRRRRAHSGVGFPVRGPAAICPPQARRRLDRTLWHSCGESESLTRKYKPWRRRASSKPRFKETVDDLLTPRHRAHLAVRPLCHGELLPSRRVLQTGLTSPSASSFRIRPERLPTFLRAMLPTASPSTWINRSWSRTSSERVDR